MSYYIEDDCKVIKTSRGFIFMALGGYNNVSTTKRVGGNRGWIEVRERHWCGPRDEILDQPEQVILDYCHRVYGDTPEYEAFMRNGKWVYYKDMDRYYRNGMRHAQSLEDIIRANPGQALIARVEYSHNGSIPSTEMEKWLCTTKSLELWIDEARAFCQQEKAKGNEARTWLSFCGDQRLVYAAAPKTTPVVIKSTAGKHASYVKSYITGKQLQFTSKLDEALVFDSEDDARAAIGSWKGVKFVSYESQQKATQKNFVLMCGVNSKLEGNYLARCTAKKLYTSYGIQEAKRFGSKNEAVRYIQNLRSKGYSVERVGNFDLMNTADETSEVLSV